MRLFLWLSLCLVVVCSGCVMNTRQANEPIKIGVILPLSGIHAWQGKQILTGVETAFEKIKSEVGGDDIAPELLLIDDKSSAKAADQAMTDLAKKGVAIVLGGYSSTEALAIKSSAMALQLPTLAPTASHDEVAVDNRYMFQLSYSDSTQAQALASYVFYNGKCRNLAFLLSLDEEDIYSRNLGHLMAQAFSDKGGRVVASAGFHGDDKDFRPLLRNVLEAYPDAIFIPAYAKVAGKLVSQLREIGYSGLIVGSDGWLSEDFIKNCGPNPSPAVFSCGYVEGINSIPQDNFIKLYRAKNGHNPGVNAAMGFDAFTIAYLATQGTLNSEEVLKKLSQFRSYDSVGGPLRMIKGGIVRRNVYINRIMSDKQGKHYIKLEATVAPNSLERLREDFDKDKGRDSVFDN